MKIYELIAPGGWLNGAYYANAQEAWQTKQLIDLTVGNFYDANIALHLFELSTAYASGPATDKEHADRWNRRQQYMADLYANSKTPQEYVASSRQADLDFKRLEWASGHFPSAFPLKTRIIHARAFLYAADAFEKALNVLAQANGVPESLKSLHTSLVSQFPDLTAVRNSSHHVEDRVRLLRHSNPPKPLIPQAIDSGGIKTSGGAIVLGNLHNSTYGSTKADGTFGQIDISDATMCGFQTIMQNALNEFHWTGAAEHLPHH